MMTVMYTTGERLNYESDRGDSRPLTVIDPPCENDDGTPYMRVKFDHFGNPSTIFRLERLSRILTNPHDLDPI